MAGCLCCATSLVRALFTDGLARPNSLSRRRCSPCCLGLLLLRWPLPALGARVLPQTDGTLMGPFAFVVAPAFIKVHTDRFPPVVCFPVCPRIHRMFALLRLLIVLASFSFSRFLLRWRRQWQVLLLFRLLAHERRGLICTCGCVKKCWLLQLLRPILHGIRRLSEDAVPRFALVEHGNARVFRRKAFLPPLLRGHPFCPAPVLCAGTDVPRQRVARATFLKPFRVPCQNGGGYDIE